MRDTCIFCKINNKEIPSFCVYEDEYFRVILDRFPASKGHLLIVCKEHYEDVFSLPQEVSEKLYPLVKKMATQLKDKLGADGINVVQNNGLAAGQTIFHFHLHLVPRYKQDQVVLNHTTNADTTIEELEAVATLLQ